MKNKKGAAAWVTLIIMMAVALVGGFVYIVIIKGNLGGVSSILGNQISAIGDCDKDGFPNSGFSKYKDQCPCIDSSNNPSKEFTGCPAGTTAEQATEDQNTCADYVNKKSLDTTYPDEDKCKDSADDAVCVQRCDTVQALVSATGSSTQLLIEGRVCDCDLKIITFTAKDRTSTVPKGGTLKLNLGGTAKDKQISIKYEVKNEVKTDGKEVTENVEGIFYLCDDNKKNCDKIKTVNLPKGNGEDTEFITVGKDGDNCDGPGKVTCHIKFEVDFFVDSVLNEGLEGEKNNIAYIKVIIENQDFDNYGFDSYKSVQIDADYRKPGSFQIQQKCDGYVGIDCNAQDSCDGDFADEGTALKAIESKGCWVMISESDGGDDCGEALAAPGHVIRRDQATVFRLLPGAPIQVRTLLSQREEIEALILSFEWTTDDEGDLLCSDNGASNYGTTVWELCDDDANGQKAYLKNGNIFRCKANQWKQLK